MAEARADHDAVVLLDGSLLVIGGRSDPADSTSALDSAERFDGSKGTWGPAAPMREPRYASAVVRLTDGRVLVTGGIGRDGQVLATVEIYDPEADEWQRAEPMSAVRSDHTATLLDDGSVLVAGGGDDRGTALASVERYDPGRNLWSDVGSMSTGRVGHTAIALVDGSVLIAGGRSERAEPLRSAERYEPDKGFAPVPDMRRVRSDHAAVRVGDDDVLLAGGCCDSAATSESLRLSTEEWSETELRESRELPGLVELPDLRALVIGGQDGDGKVTATTEIWTLRSDGWEPGPAMAQGRVRFTALAIDGRQVLVVGGVTAEGRATAEAELLDIGRLSG